MRFARVALSSGPRYAALRGDTAHILEGAPYDEAGRVETGESVPLDEAQLLVPCEPSSIFAVGRNYAEHAKEMGFDLSEQPSVFMKPVVSLLDPGGTVVLPPTDVSGHVEHEAEMVVVIGKQGRHIRAEDALDHIFGYTVADDVSARDIQRSDTHIMRGKGFDTFCPLGPWIETDLTPEELPVRCSVNGELRQDGNTRDLLFDVPALISSVSAWTTLRPGDVILTGSPSGTGPLVDGDRVEIEVGGVGTLVHHVAAG